MCHMLSTLSHAGGTDALGTEAAEPLSGWRIGAVCIASSLILFAAACPQAEARAQADQAPAATLQQRHGSSPAKTNLASSRTENLEADISEEAADVASETEDKLLEAVRQVSTRLDSALGSVSDLIKPSISASGKACFEGRVGIEVEKECFAERIMKKDSLHRLRMQQLLMPWQRP